MSQDKQNESKLDKQLDHWFAQRPITPSKDFTEKTLARIQEGETNTDKTEKDNTIVYFPQWVKGVAAIAAIVAIGFMLPMNNTGGPTADTLANMESDKAYIEIEELLLMDEALTTVAQIDNDIDLSAYLDY